jgi:hypothetical protein
MFSDKVMIDDGQFYPNWRRSLEICCITYDIYLQNCPNYITMVNPFFTTKGWLKKCQFFWSKFFFPRTFDHLFWIFFNLNTKLGSLSSNFSFPKVRFESQNKISMMMISLELV